MNYIYLVKIQKYIKLFERNFFQSAIDRLNRIIKFNVIIANFHKLNHEQ